MGLRRYLTLSLTIASAVCLTALLVWLDSSRRATAEIAFGLRLARQVVSQAEGFVWAARSRGERDPVGFAVNLLSQGIEPRVLRLWKTQESPGQAGESYHRDRQDRSFDYVKVVLPDDGVGVRVRVQLDDTGFLGARSRMARDLSVLAVFAALALAIGQARALARRLRGGSDEVVMAEESDTERANALVDSYLLPGEEQLRNRRRALSKLTEIKALLTRLGLHVRDLVREARDLTVSAAESRKSLVSLRSRVHVGIRELQDTRAALREVGDSAVQAEITALNLVVEAAQKESDPKRLGEMAETLHQIASRMRDLNQRSEAALGRIEHEVEPMARDADLAYHSFDDLFRHTREMDGHIRETTETLIGQARLIQNLGAELGEREIETARQAPPARPPRLAIK